MRFSSVFPVYTWKWKRQARKRFQSFHFGERFRFYAFLSFSCKRKVHPQRKVAIFGPNRFRVNVASDASPAKSKLLASIDDTGNKFSLHLLTHLYTIANKDVLALKRLVAIFMTKGSDFNNLLEMLYSEYEVSTLNNQQ